MIKKLNKKINFVSLGIILSLFLIVFGLTDNVLAATNTWDFSVPSDYTFDNTKIEFWGFGPQLKTIDNSNSWYNASWTKRKAITING